MKVIKNYRDWSKVFEQGYNDLNPLAGDVQYTPSQWHDTSTNAPEGGPGLTGDYDYYSAIKSENPPAKDIPTDDKWIAEKFKKLLSSEVALKSLKKRINQVIDLEVNKKYNTSPDKAKIDPINIQAAIQDYFKNDPDGGRYPIAIAGGLGDSIKISHWLGKAAVAKIIPSESNPLVGTITGTITLSINITNSELKKINPNGISIPILINISIDYNISEEQLSKQNLLMTWTIKSIGVSGSTEIKEGPFVSSPIALSINNGKANLKVKINNTAIPILKDKDLKISSYVPQKTGVVDVDITQIA
jgi:hypothetical protein